MTLSCATVCLSLKRQTVVLQPLHHEREAPGLCGMRKCAVASIRAPPPPRHRHLEHRGLSSSQPLAVGGLAVGSWCRASTYSDASRGRHADIPHARALALSQTHARALALSQTHALALALSPTACTCPNQRGGLTRVHLQRRASTSSDAPPPPATRRHTPTPTRTSRHTRRILL